ncbi:MAG: LemA family protein [archaeon]|jgi:LemA protein|nr:LemA family protein [archaeon]
MAILTWVLIGLAALIILMLIYYFNKFVVLGTRVDNSLSQIDVQLKKRADLVPNLVEVVKGYVKHEKDAINKVTEARKALLAAKDISSKVKAGDKLQGALKTIFALAENYPNLKANENFLQLQTELAAIEDKVAYSRQYYNDNIQSYNISTETFPGMMFARLFGKSRKEFIKITAKEAAVPKVEF